LQGPADFTDLATATATVPSGSTLFVRPGSYSTSVVIDGKELVVVAEAPGVRLTEPLTVRNILAASSCTLLELEMERGFLVDACAGEVQLQGCRVPVPALPATPPNSSFFTWGDCGIGESLQFVKDSSAVSFVACEFHGAHGQSLVPVGGFMIDGAPGQHGLVVERSTVAVYDSLLVGGNGGNASSVSHAPGYAGAGGDGLRVRDTGSSVRLHDVVAVGGQAGGPVSPLSFVEPGCDGVPIRNEVPASVVVGTGPATTLTVPSLARAAVPTTWHIDGPVGATAFLFAADDSEWRALPAAVGIGHTAASRRVLPLGVVPSSGRISLQVSLPAVLTATDSYLRHYQLLLRTPAGAHLGEPRRTVVVSASL
jgi:hypothetical protein